MNSTGNSITTIYRGPESGPAAYGRDKLTEALMQQGIAIIHAEHFLQLGPEFCVVIGLTQDRQVQMLLGEERLRGLKQPEGVVYYNYQLKGKRTLLIAGTDERGLMYALLEIAERVRYNGWQEIMKVGDQEEFPFNRVRGMDRYILGHMDEEWFFSEDFWQYYLARLAECRFNRFTLIMGFDTPYLTPPYPFFIEVPGYANVRVNGLDAAARARNLHQLVRIGRICREHGVEFILGTWQQKPWTAGQKNMVEGLDSDEGSFSRYCAAGLKALLEACEEIDGVQFRVNMESGIGTEDLSNDSFWKHCVAALTSVGRKLKLDIRAKGLSDDVIQYAVNEGLDVEVPTKYWCEHTGLPYHLTQMRTEELVRMENLNSSRRYSYADLLKKPHGYDVIYRLWNYGSTCIFAWGDPDYARRFSHSCRLGAAGFQVDAPLSLKGGQETLQSESWTLYKDTSYMDGKWEDERYWLRYILYGRLGYSPETNPEVWQRQFSVRFGPEAAKLMERGYRSSGKILPLITASHMPVHPSLLYWPELSTGGALFAENNYNTAFAVFSATYLNTEPGDHGLFYGIEDYVEDSLAEKLNGKYTPLQVAAWLSKFASDIRDSLDKTDKMTSIAEDLEYKTTRLDFLMLADLAEYHVHKIRAALELCFYLKTHQSDCLDNSLSSMLSALEFWKALSAKGSCFHDNLEFGMGKGTDRHGHWRDRLEELEKDVARLRQLRQEIVQQADIPDDKNAGYGHSIACDCPAFNLPSFEVDWPETWPAGQDLPITVRTGDVNDIMSGFTLHYRHTNQTEGKFISVQMDESSGIYTATIPGEYITAEWDLLVYLSAVDSARQGLIFPGLYHARYPAPYHIIQVISG